MLTANHVFGQTWFGQYLVVSIWGLCVIASSPVGVAQVPDGAKLRTLDSRFPFSVPASAAEWEERAEELRFHLQMSLGLWPLPEKTPLNAVEHGTIELEDYTVSRVYFESFPGFFVTGSLYRPKGQAAPGPGILCPHGHFRSGRFTKASDQEIERMINSGEERYPENARSPLQARCAHLARMGCTVFHYDMIGYADSRQISEAVAHGFAKQREGQNDPSAYAFFSPQAELHLQSIMGLQTWNSIRALDYLTSLPEVDASRIGVTGCSGGGTQTFILAALDSRVTAAFPAAMVSTGMQGGCVCENCCNLRTVTGNVELTALAAPRPVALSAANDWTRTMPEDGMPQLQALYELLGVPDHTFLSASLTFPHGYNQVARRVMYGWFDRHLGLQGNPDGLTLEQIHAGEIPETSPLFERPIRFLTDSELTVWNEEHPAPATGVEIEHQVTQHWREDQEQQIAKLLEEISPDLKRAVRSLLCDLPGGPEDDRLRVLEDGLPADLEEEVDGLLATKITIGNRRDTPGFDVEVMKDKASKPPLRTSTVVITSDIGSSVAQPWFRELIRGQDLTIVIDASRLSQPNELVNNGREAAGYTFGYNRPVAARQARVIAWILDHLVPAEVEKLNLIVFDEGAAPAIGGLAASRREGTSRLFLPAEFSFSKFDSFQNSDFLPGAMKLGDAAGFLKIAQADDVVVIGEDPEQQAELLRQHLLRVD